MNDKNIIGGVVALVLVIGGVLFIMSGDTKKSSTANTATGVVSEAPSGVLVLAQCLKDSGATFYGAFWCSHCEKQRALFGDAVSALPYVECSTPDGKNQTAICKEKGITGYPTWIFKDGSQLSGEQSFASLANKTACIDPTASTAVEVVSDAVPPSLPTKEVPKI